jgi:hypothetical protein
MLTSLLTAAIIALAMPAGPDGDRSSRPSRQAVVKMLRSDMTKPHEAQPHGVPTSYDWAKGPRARPTPPPRDWTAFTAWGQLYRCAGAPFDARQAVEVRDLQTWILVGRRWRRVQQSSELGGASFAEDYKRPPVGARVVQRTPEATRVKLREGYNFHFWPAAGRISFSPGKVRAITVVARARLAGRGGTDSCLAMSVSGDYWRSLTAQPEGSKNATDAGIGRFKRIGTRWRAFSMTTASSATLARRPLPLRLPRFETR